MSEFRFQARQQDLTIVGGTIQGESVSQVSQHLLREGLFPISVSPLTMEDSGNIWTGRISVFRLFKIRKKLSAAKHASLAQVLSELLMAGLPIQDALSEMKSHARDTEMKCILESVSYKVKNGQSLHQALSSAYPLVSPSFTGAINSGETAGNLTKVLKGLAALFEQDAQLYQTLKKALIYPSIVLVVALGSIGVLFAFLLPRLSGVYSDMSQELPWATRALISTSNGFSEYWVFFLISIGVLVGLFKVSVSRFSKFKLWYSRFLVSVPIVGPVLKMKEMVLFFESVSGLVNGGLPLTNALSLTSLGTSNVYVREEIVVTRDRLLEGSSFCQAIRGTIWDQGSLVSMIQIGEANGDLETALVNAKSMLEVGLKNRAKTLSTLIEPALIVFLGLVVGFVVFAMMMPIVGIEV